jgi:hypothetical protein
MNPLGGLYSNVYGYRQQHSMWTVRFRSSSDFLMEPAHMQPRLGSFE